jgi:hypothetical protein
MCVVLQQGSCPGDRRLEHNEAEVEGSWTGAYRLLRDGSPTWQSFSG